MLFFFKQKTAYEMRISYWSSAVCSSDLADIASGRYAPGDRLPPERALVERFEVSRLTVRAAMIGMEILGLVEARRGSGVYVTGRPSGGLHASEIDIGAFEMTEARRLREGECGGLADRKRKHLKSSLKRAI